MRDHAPRRRSGSFKIVFGANGRLVINETFRRATAHHDNQVVAHLDHLVNTIGPRLTASHNDHLACEWARDLFKEWGLENVVMEKAGEFPVQFQRGPFSGKMLEPEVLALEFGTASWSAGTRGAVKG